MYDYLIVGCGLFGATFAQKMHEAGKKCLIIERRTHIAGNAYTESINQIVVHMYGAHIFHTSDAEIWEYVNRFLPFRRFINSPLAYYQGEIYNLPFNMNTFSKMWGITSPKEARAIIEMQKEQYKVDEPKNLQEQAINLVGTDIYEKLIKGYTTKQWGMDPKQLPPSIIKRLPVRYTYDNNYFDDTFQGIPQGGYTELVKQMVQGIDLRLNEDYFAHRDLYDSMAKTVVFTGRIDQYFDFCFGELDYRSLKFIHEVMDEDNFQGNAVVNYTDVAVPYTRIIEHKFFDDPNLPGTVITKEYPALIQETNEPYYPITDDKNLERYERYRDFARTKRNVIFGGRLGEYRYYDMHHVIRRALDCAKNQCAK
ncbi:MAG: UDP-galactopyranose mutase [Candidatus Izemoplasmatales bacterium]|jgi:UDP-galactopyranose mutase